MAGSSKKVVYFALVGNGLIAVTKFIAASISGSSAMLSEAIHSVVDTGNQLLILLGMRRSSKPPTDDFPFGHGKELYFWSFVVAILIFAVGAGLSMYEGIHHILDPSPIRDPTINYVVLAFAIVFEGGALYVAITEFNKARGDMGFIEAVREMKDPAMFTVVFEDTAAMAGLLVALVSIFIGQMTGNVYVDGIASVLIGVILAIVAVFLAIETKGLLIGERARSTTVDGIRDLVIGHENVEKINELLTMHVGPQFVLANISVNFDNAIDAAEVEETVTELDRDIKAMFPRVKRVFIEAEAWAGRNVARRAVLTGEHEAVTPEAAAADDAAATE